MSFTYKILFLLFFCLNGLHASNFEVVRFESKYGLRNVATQEWSIPPIYEALGWSNGSQSINNELIGAKLNEKWALLSIDGSKVTAHLFAEITPYYDKTFIVAKREDYSIRLQYGLIDRKGKEIIPIINDQLLKVQDKLITIKSSKGVKQAALLTAGGKEILGFEYSDITVLEPNRIVVVNQESKAALFNLDGTQLSSFDYEQIMPYQKGFYEVTYYGRKGLIDAEGQLIIAPVYKAFRVENNEARGLPFPQWDVYEDSDFDQSYFFDQVFPLTHERSAVNYNHTGAIINQQNEFLFYQEQRNFIATKEGLAIIQDTQSGYYGIVKAEGTSVLEPNYDSILFQNQFIMASIQRPNGSNWRLFDLTGNRIGLNTYEFIEPYGTLFKAKRNGKYGLISKSGTEISPFLYDKIDSTQHPLAVVSYQNRKGLIDTQGNWVITPYYDSIFVGSTNIYLEQGSQVKIASLEGNIKTNTYDLLTLLPQGYALTSTKGLSVFDFSNKRLLQDTYDSLDVLSEDIYVLYKNGKKSLFQPRTGLRIELDMGITQVKDYAEGFIKIKKDGQYGFINKRGQLKIANRYQQVQPFSEGMAAVQLIGNWGYIDQDESLRIQPSFEEALPFRNGLAVVRQGEYFGLIGPNAESVLNTQFDQIYRYEQHIIIESNGLFGLVNKKGQLIKAPQYEKIEPLHEGVFKVTKANKVGVIDISGQDLVPISYQEIIAIGNRFFCSMAPSWEPIRMIKN